VHTIVVAELLVGMHAELENEIYTPYNDEGSDEP
jgi:hypothetical protein